MAKKVTKDASVKQTVEEMKQDVSRVKTELFEAKRDHVAGDLVNPRVITKKRKEIARLLTKISAAEVKEKK